MNLKSLLPHIVVEKRLLLGEDWRGAVIGDVVEDDEPEYATVTIKALRWLGIEFMYQYSED